MAKRLPTEDLIKKYQYLKTNQKNSSRTDTNPKANENDRTSYEEFYKYSSE